MEEEKDKSNVYNIMMQNLQLLNSKAKEKKEELDLIKQQIKQAKLVYNKKIKEYNALMNTVIQKEIVKDNIQKSICKLYYSQELIVNQISVNFVKSFNDNISLINHNVKLLLATFFNCSDISSFDYLISILNTSSDWKEFLKMLENNKTDCIIDNFQYDMLLPNPASPVDFIIVFILNYYKIKQYLHQIEGANKEINQLSETKNTEFIYLKSIEGEIIKKDCLYKNMIRYIKGIYFLFDKYNKIKQSCHNSNFKTNTSSYCSAYSDLAKSIIDFKQINIINYCDPDNYIARATIKSEYSEEMSYLSFQTQGFGLNQSNYNVENNLINLNKNRKSNSKEEEVILDMKNLVKQHPQKEKAFQQLTACTIQKCSEGKIHKKRLTDDEDRFDNDCSMYKEDNVPTEDTDERMINDKTIKCYNKECNNRTHRESDDLNNQINSREQSFDFSDIECDLNSRNATEQKQIKQMNSISVQPSKLFEEKHQSKKQIKKKQSLHEQL